jgi:signal transduction histidine kinase
VDSGVGIAPAQLGRIFELFRQGDDSHTRKHEGVGLGLSLVRACLALLRGECRIMPGPQGGTVVELRLPELPEVGAGTAAIATGSGVAAVAGH